MTENQESHPVEGSLDQVTPEAGASEETATQASDEVTQDWSQVEIDGRKFQSPEELKEWVKKRVYDKESYITQRDEQVKALSEQLAEVRGQLKQLNTPEVKEEDEEAEFLANPTQYVNKVKAQAVEEAKKLLEEREKQIYGNLTAVETERKQWNEFLDHKPHLKVLGKTTDEAIGFLKVLAKDLAPKVSHMPRSQALEKLADRANEFVLQIRGSSERTPGTPRPSQTKDTGIPKTMTKDEYNRTIMDSLKAERDKINPSYTNLPQVK